VARLNVRGVSAMNRNDHKAARNSFEQAYKLDPNNSFAINNMGYLAELEGDKETAQSYYEQAQQAERARQKVMVSTRPELEGQTSGQVAAQSSTLVESTFAARASARRSSGAPPVLKTRDNRNVIEPKTKPSSNITPPEFRHPPEDEEAPIVATQQSDQPANQNPPELKTRPQQQQPQQQQPPPASHPQPPNKQPPQN